MYSTSACKIRSGRGPHSVRRCKNVRKKSFYRTLMVFRIDTVKHFFCLVSSSKIRNTTSTVKWHARITWKQTCFKVPLSFCFTGTLDRQHELSDEWASWAYQLYLEQFESLRNPKPYQTWSVCQGSINEDNDDCSNTAGFVKFVAHLHFKYGASCEKQPCICAVGNSLMFMRWIYGISESLWGVWFSLWLLVVLT